MSKHTIPTGQVDHHDRNEYTIEILKADDTGVSVNRKQAKDSPIDAIDDTTRHSLGVPRLVQIGNNNAAKENTHKAIENENRKLSDDQNLRCYSSEGDCCFLRDLPCVICRRKGTLRVLPSETDDLALSERNKFKRSRAYEGGEMCDQDAQTVRDGRLGSESLVDDRRQWQSILRNLFVTLARSGDTGALSSLRLWKSVTMRKETFLQIFPQLPGVVGERLFAAFDRNKNGVVDFREFCLGLSILCSAELYQKLEFVFHMYDLNGDGLLSRDELSMMLYYIPASISFLSAKTIDYSSSKTSNTQDPLLCSKNSSRDNDNGSLKMLPDDRQPEEEMNINKALLNIMRNFECEQSPDLVTEFERLVDRLVNQAFQIFNIREHSNEDESPSIVEEMDFSTFCEAVLKFPDLRVALEVFCDETIQPYSFLPIPPDMLHDNLSGASSSRKLTPLASRSFSQKLTDRFGIRSDSGQILMNDFKDRLRKVQCDHCGGLSSIELAPSLEEPADLATIPHKLGLTKDSYSVSIDNRFSGADMTGWLVKIGRLTGRRIRRFFVLRDRFLYYYRHARDSAPMKAIVLTGARIERTWNDNIKCRGSRDIDHGSDEASDWENEEGPHKNRFRTAYGIAIKFSKGRNTVLYAATKRERDLWMQRLTSASGGVNSFHDLYSLKEPLGRGRFATVFTAIQKSTNERVAVKILKRPSVSSHGKVRNRGNRGRRRRFLSFQWLLGSKSDDGRILNEPDEVLREFQRNEIAVLRLLYHPNLIKLIDVLSTREFLYIVMEWNPSGDIQRILETVIDINDQLAANSLTRVSGDLEEIWIPEWIVRQTVQGLLRGLTFLHSPRRNIIHRDLKPENVLLKINCGQIQNGMAQCIPGLPNLGGVPGEVDRKRARLSRLSKSATMGMDSRRDTNYCATISPKMVPSEFQFPDFRDVDPDDVREINKNDGAAIDDPLAEEKSLPSKIMDLNRADMRTSGRVITNTQSNTRQDDDADCNFDSSSIDTIDLYSMRDRPSAFSDREAEKLLDQTPSVNESSLLSKLPSANSNHYAAQIKSNNSSSSCNSPTKKLKERVSKVAMETLNFWIFVHCLDVCQAKVEDRTVVRFRNDRRASTYPAQPVSKIHQSVCSNVVQRLIDGDSRQWLEVLSTDTTEMAMNGLFSSSLIKDCAVPKVTDFGLSKIIAPPARAENYPSKKNLDSACIVDMTSYAKEALGTAAYAAPEVLQGLRYTTSADMWSLGVIIYQLLSGGNFPIFRLNSQVEENVQYEDSMGMKGVVSVSRSLVDIVESLDLNWKKWVLVFEPRTAWTRVSATAKDFVSLLLTVDPQQRMSARAALDHDWICDESVFPDCNSFGV